MTRIDRDFCTISWSELHADLQALSSLVSDHCSLILYSQEYNPRPPIFIFEAHWALMPGFVECVQEAWSWPISSRQNEMMILHINLVDKIARQENSTC
jgi:hypothetical protein